MPFNVPRDLPGLYDLGIETRDASTLACLDRNGQTKNISQLGLVGVFGDEQGWATELQEKSKLVQLQSSIVDREFDQWVQYSQGDWSGGMGVRVAPAGQSPTQYWDGLGLIWPYNDWQPQQPYDFGRIATPAASNKSNPSGAVGGVIAGYGAGYLMGYANGSPSHWTTYFNYGTNSAAAGDPYGVNVAPLAMAVGGGSGWAIAPGGGGNVVLFRHDQTSGTVLNTVSFGNLVTDVGNFLSTFGTMAVGLVSGKLYVASQFQYRSTAAGTPLKNVVVVADMSAPSALALTTLQLPVAASGLGLTVTQMGFQGGNLVVSISDGQTTSLWSYSFSSATWSTLMQIPGTQAYFTVVGGNLFILNVTAAGSSIYSTMDLYSLVGSTLNYLGVLPPYLGETMVTGFTLPAALGPYAVFGVSYSPSTVSPLHTPICFAYDMLRGRLFKVWVAPNNYAGSLGQGLSLATMEATYHQVGVPQFIAQWGILVPLGVASSANYFGEELWFGIGTTPGGPGNPTLQGATDITSSIIDMTSSQNKLWRQIVVTLTQAMQNINLVGVTIKVWIDKELTNLGAPDFQKTVLGNDATTPAAQVVTLPLNKIGRKLIYEVVTIGGTYTGGAWYSAPKVQSVVVQTATGWVIDYKCAFSRATLTNAMQPNDYLFDRQGVDEVAGANFLRNLWRQKGGYCKVSLPNGDSYNAVLQLLGGKSKKLQAPADSAASEENRWEQVIGVRIREDI